MNFERATLESRKTWLDAAPSFSENPSRIRKKGDFNIMTDREMNKADFYTSIILFIFSVGVIVMSLRMPSMVDRNESRWSAPGVVPAFIGIALLLLSGSMLVRSLLRGAFKPDADKAGNADVTATAKSSHKKPTFSVSTLRIFVTLALCVFYAIALGKIWFPLATALFIFLFISVFEFNRSKPIAAQWKTFVWAAVIATITSALVTIIFQYLFLVNLP